MSELFGQPYDQSDRLWVLKAYFDIMYSDGNFIAAVKNICRKWGYSTDGAYCRFPDLNSFFQEDHFEGVEFAYGIPPDEITVYVDERTCLDFVGEACEIYISRHPESRLEIARSLEAKSK
jgi:hypothetical protein